MSIRGLLARFAILYLGLWVVVSVTLRLLGIQAGSGAGIGVLFGSVLAACLWFASRNERTFAAEERRAAFIGMWAISLGLQMLIALVVVGITGIRLPIGPMLFALVLISVSYAVIIFFSMRIATRQFARKDAPRGR